MNALPSRSTLSLALLLASIVIEPSASAQSAVAGFPIDLSGEGVNRGSVTIADVDGDGQADDIVVGGRDGIVYAYRTLPSSPFVQLIFSFDTGTASIDSRPAVGDVDGDGLPEVVVTAGSTEYPQNPPGAGRLVVLEHTGALKCDLVPGDVLPGPGDGIPDGIFTSPALADLDRNDGGKLEIVFGAWDHLLRARHHDCTELWTLEVRETVFSSPAIGDLDHDGDLDVVVGVDSHFEGPPYNTSDGGRLLAVDGASGVSLAGFPLHFDEVIASSPALADLDGDDRLDIIVGTGNCWGAGNGCGVPPHPGVGEYIIAVDRDGAPLPGWPVSISAGNQIASGSPAIADLDGNGDLEVVVNGFDRDDNSGKLWVIEHTGSIRGGFPKTPLTPDGCAGATVSFATGASPILADVDNDSDLDIVLPSNGELVVYDANSGTQLSRQALGNGICTPVPPGSLVFGTGGTVAGSAAVGDIDNDGSLELVVGGYTPPTPPNPPVDGAIFAWDLATAASTNPPWPMFKRNAAGTSLLPLEPLFADDFEAGDTMAWSSTVP